MQLYAIGTADTVLIRGVLYRGWLFRPVTALKQGMKAGAGYLISHFACVCEFNLIPVAN